MGTIFGRYIVHVPSFVGRFIFHQKYDFIKLKTTNGNQYTISTRDGSCKCKFSKEKDHYKS